ncbi:type 2C protein phosphatase PTC7 Ecym_8170 [Eremothecium cymbalariae DBVPG|uniref:Protein phosphatase n=1 Tax=Eremothecium cymbalariae (strain CBS 270.75 / DBVPG 7215 / KCTC 17166 / NRRL Y-17582) TaxID=931890 RepID=G8JX82_ERECY|nr:Hypothetical protein Ecym_8170 [Eremothecium cymbalariae DBVPG\
MFIGIRPARFTRSMWFIFWLLLIPFILTKTDFYQSTAKRYFTHHSGTSSYHSHSSSYGGDFSALSYQVAVAYQPKDRSDSTYGNVQVTSPTGEDNYFVAVKSMNEVYAGVADGVGGWANHGYDSSAISSELCRTMKEISLKAVKDLGPKQLLDLAYLKVKQDGIVKVGSTTAVVAHLSPDGKLNVANLGDSWCGVFRESKLMFETKFQTLKFNTPYQLSIIPDEILKQAAKKGSSFIQNKPSDADEYSFQLMKNDVVVLATDGVTDNICTEDMELFLKDHGDSEDLQNTTQEFVSLVEKLSKDNMFPSVFSQELSKLSGKPYLGGKEDDITVVVVKVN